MYHAWLVSFVLEILHAQTTSVLEVLHAHTCTCIRVVNFTKRLKSLATGSDEEMDVFYHIVGGVVLVVAVVVTAVAVTVAVDVVRMFLLISSC